MSTDVKFGDLEKLANTDGVKEVYLANYYDEPVVMPSMDSANDMTNITKVRGYDTGKGTVSLRSSIPASPRATRRSQRMTVC